MPEKLNTSDFNLFITKSGHEGVTSKIANRYADVGKEIINLAMTATDREEFMEQMSELEERLAKEITPPNPKYSISNMASCFLYAQTRDNFEAGQGFGKGSNINQYGDPTTSNKAVGNLMAYFSQQKPGKECGYNAGSTHDRWRKDPPPGDIKDWKLRIDIESDPKTGSIPAPLKGIHTLHIVPGVDNSGHTKLLVKPENWGMQKLSHKILHLFDFILTRFTSQNIESLEGRQETKLTKEAVVKQELQKTNADLKSKIDNVGDKSLKDLFKQMYKVIKSAESKKGFEKPLQTLADISKKLGEWLNVNLNHAEKGLVKAFEESVEDKIIRLQERQISKYGSEYQQKSEVRLMYDTDGTTPTSKVDTSNAEKMKAQFQELRQQRKAPVPEIEPQKEENYSQQKGLR